MGAVIHNAGVFFEPSRSTTAEGHAKTLAVNALALYLLTALIHRPDRLIYLSSGLHHAGTGSLADIAWTERRWDAAQAIPRQAVRDRARALRALGRTYSATPSIQLVPTKMGGLARWFRAAVWHSSLLTFR